MLFSEKIVAILIYIIWCQSHIGLPNKTTRQTRFVLRTRFPICISSPGILSCFEGHICTAWLRWQGHDCSAPADITIEGFEQRAEATFFFALQSPDLDNAVFEVAHAPKLDTSWYAFMVAFIDNAEMSVTIVLHHTPLDQNRLLSE